MRNHLRSGLVFPSVFAIASFAAAQPSTPCGPVAGILSSYAVHGLVPASGGELIYDANQHLCWLTDANLAGNPAVRAAVHLLPVNLDGSVPTINPDGTMNYETALNWVAALNLYNNGKGWLGHNNWQLPASTAADDTCSSQNNGNFGILCTGSALANLYNIGLARTYPDSVVPWFTDFAWPFFNLHPGLYWTSDSTTTGNNVTGDTTFSFNTGDHGSNTTRYNFFHVLPYTINPLGPVPAGPGVVPYSGGAGAGLAVYDTNTGFSWPIDANLPASQDFGFSGTITIKTEVNGTAVTVPLIDPEGAVHFNTVDPAAKTGWIDRMNKRVYLGSSMWTLPALKDLEQLYADLGLRVGDPRLEWPSFAGPFLDLQPGFYWSCERDQQTGPDGPCDPNLMPGTAPNNPTLPMRFSFNFDDGFLGTDENTKQFYVMVYFTATEQAPVPGPKPLGRPRALSTSPEFDTPPANTASTRY